MRRDGHDSWVVALIGLGLLLVALALMAVIVGCSRHHDDNSPLPSATATTCCNEVECVNWHGHGQTKTFCLDTDQPNVCFVDDTCYFNCPRGRN